MSRNILMGIIVSVVLTTSFLGLISGNMRKIAHSSMLTDKTTLEALLSQNLIYVGSYELGFDNGVLNTDTGEITVGGSTVLLNTVNSIEVREVDYVTVITDDVVKVKTDGLVEVRVEYEIYRSVIRRVYYLEHEN